MATSVKEVSKSKKKEIGEEALQILFKEYDALREMYSQAVHNGQTMFNYYLTLMTAVFGGVALVFQPSSGYVMQKMVGGLLLIFFAVVGSFYLSSLSTNFAHVTRYARGINEVRRLLVERFDVPVPSVYLKFLARTEEGEPSRIMFIASLLIPVNTYVLFAATVNGIAWALAIFIIYLSVGVDSQVVSRGILSFMTIYLIYSVYARLIYHLTISRLNISIGH
jgi:hypothetical protein